MLVPIVLTVTIPPAVMLRIPARCAECQHAHGCSDFLCLYG